MVRTEPADSPSISPSSTFLLAIRFESDAASDELRAVAIEADNVWGTELLLNHAVLDARTCTGYGPVGGPTSQDEPGNSRRDGKMWTALGTDFDA